MNQYTRVYLSKLATFKPYKWGDWIGPGIVNGIPVQPTPTITQPSVEESSSSSSLWVNPLIRTGIRISILAGVIAYSLKKIKEKEEEEKKTISKPTNKPLPDSSPESTKKLPLN